VFLLTCEIKMKFARYKKYIVFSNKYLLVAIVVGLIFSLLLNLGFEPLRLEEPRRIIVALEMLFRNNFIVPTIGGIVFYDHPPLWNIVLAFALKTLGYYPFVIRFCCVVFFVCTGWYVFYLGKKYIGYYFGVLASFLYLTNGEMLFYYSLTGEMDIFFSFLIFISLISIYKFGQEQKYTKVFIFSYGWCSLAVLTKGPAAVVFTFITLLTYFIYKKKIKVFFSIKHLLGLMILALLVSCYYLSYSKYADIEKAMSGLWYIVSSKSAVNRSILEFIAHFITFPIELFIAMLPGSAFLLLLIHKDIRDKIQDNSFIKFLLFAAIANFVPYWFTPGASKRYLYAIYPMVLMISAFCYMHSKSRYTKSIVVIKKVFQVLIVILAIVILVGQGVFVTITNQQRVISIFVALFLFYISYLLKKVSFYTKNSLTVNDGLGKEYDFNILMVITFIVLKVFFNTVVVTNRLGGQKTRSVALSIVQRVKEDHLAVLNSSGIPDLHRLCAYIELESKKTLTYLDRPDKDRGPMYYLVSSHALIPSSRKKIIANYELENKAFILLKTL
jgi:4-amino-4-deoxy-L-arabinose transferase-like glycosyltransferase